LHATSEFRSSALKMYMLQQANAARSEVPENGMPVTVSSSTRSSPEYQLMRRFLSEQNFFSSFVVQTVETAAAPGNDIASPQGLPRQSLSTTFIVCVSTPYYCSSYQHWPVLWYCSSSLSASSRIFEMPRAELTAHKFLCLESMSNSMSCPLYNTILN
jgi:hypothetical protein